MRIVHLIFSMEVGGAETMLVDILNVQALCEEVHLVIINSRYNDSLLQEIDKNVVVHKINRKAGSKNLLHILRLNFVLFTIKPDIIHSHDASIIKLIPFIRTASCLTVHDTGLYSDCYSRYNILIAISESVRKDVLSRYQIDPVVIPNGVCFYKIKQKQGRGRGDGKFRIVQVSRLDTPKKGQDILIKALEILKNRGIENIFLDLIGIGESEYELKRLVSELGLQEHVSFLGLKPRSYIYEHLCDYELFVQPSRNEGFGLTVAEAIGAKIPVLVSNIEGPMEIINGGSYGFSFEVGNPNECALMIEQIYKKDITTDVEVNYKSVLTRYGIANLVQRYKQTYEEII